MEEVGEYLDAHMAKFRELIEKHCQEGSATAARERIEKNCQEGSAAAARRVEDAGNVDEAVVFTQEK